VLTSAEFNSRYTDGRAGFFDPKTQTITVGDGDLANADDGAIMLAHEGTHAIDHFEHHGFVGGMASMMWSMTTGVLGAPFHLKNPATAGVDALRSNVNNEEVTAYMAQAVVEDELHIQEKRVADFGHDDSGALRSKADTKEALAAVSIYQVRGPLRVALTGLTGVLVGGGAVSAVGFGMRKLTGKELPGWASYAAIGALAGAMLLDDVVRHRQPTAGLTS